MMTAWSFVWQFGLACLALGAAVYLPGRLAVRWLRLDVNPLEHLAVSLVAGMSLLVLVYWGLSWFQAAGWLWAFVLLAGGGELGWWIYRALTRVPLRVDQDEAPETLARHWPLGLLMLAGMFAQAWFMIFTGWQGPEGMTLFAWHGHDAPWHVYNLYQLSKAFPPELPGFAGATLRNYHFFSDLFWGAILRLAPIDPWHAYLRVAPLFYGALLSLTTFVAARTWSGSLKTAYLAAVLTAFTSNFGYVLPLFFGAQKYFFWDSIFWVQSPLTTIFNPGVSSSYGLVMIGLWALQQWLRQGRLKFLLLLGLVWGLLPGFKVYPGLLVVGTLLAAGLLRLIYNKETRLLAALAAVLPIFLLVFLPSNLHSPSLVRLLPGFNLATMLVSPDRMGLMSSTALKLLFAHKPLAVALLLGALIPVFLIGNLGVRALGLKPLWRALRHPGEADPMLLFIAVFTAAALAAPILFVQTGLQWNTIQFFYYAVLVTALPAAAWFWNAIDHVQGFRQYVWIAVFIGLGLPGAVQACFRMDWGARLSSEYCEAYDWLRKETKDSDVILRPLPEPLQTGDGYAQWQRLQVRGRMTTVGSWSREATALSQQTPAEAAAAAAEKARLAPKAPLEKIWPIGWMDTTLVAALTRRNTFLEDTVSAQILGYPVAGRVEAARHFYLSANVIEARDFLEKNRITYIVVDAKQPLPFEPAGVPLKKVFANPALILYKYVPPVGW